MIDITKITELFCKHPIGKALQGLIIAVMLFMFFEQYTDTFKLARLKKAAEILQKTEVNSAKIAISGKIQDELQQILNSQPVSPWWWRIISGWILFFLISIFWWKSDKLAVLRINLMGLLFALLLALLPDFLPSSLHCMAVSACLLLILGTIIVHQLHTPSERKLTSISEE